MAFFGTPVVTRLVGPSGLRTGLEAINDLPAAAVVCKSVPPSAREIVARHLPAVIAWLRDFEAAWSENPR